MSFSGFAEKILCPSGNWKEALKEAMYAFNAEEIYSFLENKETKVLSQWECGHLSHGEFINPQGEWFGKIWWFSKLLSCFDTIEYYMRLDQGHLPRDVDGLEELRKAMGGYLYCTCILEAMSKHQEEYQEPDSELVTNRVKATQQLIHDKSEDYGQSFRRFPLLCVSTRLWEKISRYLSVSSRGACKFEKLEDTLADMIGWSVIGFALFYE